MGRGGKAEDTVFNYTHKLITFDFFFFLKSQRLLTDKQKRSLAALPWGLP